MRPAPALDSAVASAFVASAAASALTGVASAQAVFSTLNSASFTLTSLNGTPVSSSASYTGPSNNLSFHPMSAMSVPNTGSATVGIIDVLTRDFISMNYSSPNGADVYAGRMSWDVTFNASLGGAKLDNMTSYAGATLTATLFGGSAVALSVGDTLTNGRYTIEFDFVTTSTNSGISQVLWFEQGTPSGGGGGVPLPGAAGLAAVGLAGLSRRRRR